MNHDFVEKNIGMMIILTVVAISFGALVEIVPLFFLKETTEPVEGLEPLPALALEGRDIYIREGCNNCHSQMIRALRAETERYGHYSVAGEFVYDHPHLWGSKRTGPDLARVGGRYSDEWHRVHLNNPRDVVPESNMPSYPWLSDRLANEDEDIIPRMKALQFLGHPYSEEEISNAPAELEGLTEMDVLIIYLQGMGDTFDPDAQADDHGGGHGGQP